jgi:hypothetical protein
MIELKFTWFTGLMHRALTTKGSRNRLRKGKMEPRQKSVFVMSLTLVAERPAGCEGAELVQTRAMISSPQEKSLVSSQEILCPGG